MLGNLAIKQMTTLLQSEVIGRLGCSAEGTTYVVPITYAFENGYIYGHTKEGLKVDLMRKNSSVCFEVDHIENMTSWQTVLIQGLFEELAGAEASDGMEILTSRLMPLSTSETVPSKYSLEHVHSRQNLIGENVAFRVKVKEMTGRYEKNDE